MGVVHWGQTSEGDTCRCYLSSTICRASATSERLHPPFPVLTAFPFFKLFPAGRSGEENSQAPGQLKMYSCRAFPACHSASALPLWKGPGLDYSLSYSPRITPELPLEGRARETLLFSKCSIRPNQKEDRDTVSAPTCRKRQSGTHPLPLEMPEKSLSPTGQGLSSL